MFQWEARGERLGMGDQDLVDRFARYDLYPRVSRPLSLSFLQVTPEVQLRYTHYGATLTDEDGITGPSLDRRYAEASVDMRGPTFSRVFNTPGNFYSDKCKHVIGPRSPGRYRSRVDDFDFIPKFDGIDYHLGTNQVRYSLVQRLLAKRPAPRGQARVLRVLRLARLADLLRPDRGRPERVRPQLLLLGLRPRRRPRAPVARSSRGSASGPPRASPRTSTWSTT